MADKIYRLIFEKDDGTEESVEFTAPQGPRGDTGATPKLVIGTVETLEAGDDATASIGGTAENPVLNLGIPKGADGEDSSQNVDLTGYAKETWVQEGFQPKGDYLTEVPEGYAKTEDIPTKPEDIGALPSTYTPPNQTAEQVGADPKGTAETAVSEHNTDTDAHNDLRLELKALSDRLTAFFDSDDTTLDELSEIVAYITNNKTLIDSITTSKVSVADIVNNLTTNVANKPLSAAQGVALKGLIDAVSTSLANYQPKGDYALRSELPTVPTNVSAFTNDAGYLTEHQDISGKVDKVGLTLGRHADGLLYVFVDGQPVGNGVDLPAGGIDGYITPDKQIVFNNLPDGEYTLAYINDDGSIVPIGAMEKDTNVYYTVTNTLTNCVSSNSDTQAIGGKSYSATITAKSGYELSFVKVTMGGTDISSTAVSSGIITIAEVTGDIVITAVAEEAQATEPVAVDIALTDGIRIGSDGGDRPVNGMCATEMIDLRSIPKPCTINLTKAQWCSDGTSSSVRYYVANASGTALANGVTIVGSTDYFTVVDNSGGGYSDVTVTVTSDDVGYVRFSGYWSNTKYSDSSNKFADANTKATLTYTPGT